MREEVLSGSTRRITTGCGNLYITLNKNKEGVPVECFVRLGKAGGCASCQTEALGRLITNALRAGSAVGDIAYQLKGIGCHLPHGFGHGKILSCADAVAVCLTDFIDLEKLYAEETKREATGCPELELASSSTELQEEE